MQLLLPCMQHQSKRVRKQCHAASANDQAWIGMQVSEPLMLCMAMLTLADATHACFNAVARPTRIAFAMYKLPDAGSWIT